MLSYPTRSEKLGCLPGCLPSGKTLCGKSQGLAAMISPWDATSGPAADSSDADPSRAAARHRPACADPSGPTMSRTSRTGLGPSRLQSRLRRAWHVRPPPRRASPSAMLTARRNGKRGDAFEIDRFPEGAGDKAGDALELVAREAESPVLSKASSCSMALQSSSSASLRCA